MTAARPVAAAAAPDPMMGQRLQNLAAQNPGAITEVIRPQPVFSQRAAARLPRVPGAQPAAVHAARPDARRAW